jgi:hypothetical protein
MAILTRSICGLVNGTAPNLKNVIPGNIAVAKCMLGEITDASNQSTAFALFAFCFGLGSLVAPIVGGVFEHPADKFQVFSTPFWNKYPYLLPCLLSGCISLVALIVGWFVLEETARRVRRRSASIPSLELTHESELLFDAEDARSISIDEEAYKEPLLTLSHKSRSSGETNDARAPMESFVWSDTLVTVLAYSILAFTHIVFQEVFVLFCTTKRHDGGLEWSPSSVGLAMALAGVGLLTAQLVLYPRIQRRIGIWRTFNYGMALQVPLFLVTGFISYPNDQAQIWALVVVHSLPRVILQCMAITSVTVMVNNSASREMLGPVNGVAQASCTIHDSVQTYKSIIGTSARTVVGRNPLVRVAQMDRFMVSAQSSFYVYRVICCGVGWISSSATPSKAI